MTYLKLFWNFIVNTNIKYSTFGWGMEGPKVLRDEALRLWGRIYYSMSNHFDPQKKLRNLVINLLLRKVWWRIEVI
jgi:hypothetical protein